MGAPLHTLGGFARARGYVDTGVRGDKTYKQHKEDHPTYYKTLTRPSRQKVKEGFVTPDSHGRLTGGVLC